MALSTDDYKAIANLGARASAASQGTKIVDYAARTAQAQRGILESSQHQATVKQTALRNAPQVGQQQIATNGGYYQQQDANNGQGQADQSAMAAYLRQRSQGQGGPSAAQSQLMDQTAMAQHAARSVAMGNRSNPYAAMRQADAGNERSALLAQQQSAALGAQDQIDAQSQLGNYLQQMRGGDLALAGAASQRAQGFQGQQMQGSQFYAQQEAQRNLANADAENASYNRQQDMWTQYMNALQAREARQQDIGYATLGGAAELVGKVL